MKQKVLVLVLISISVLWLVTLTLYLSSILQMNMNHTTIRLHSRNRPQLPRLPLKCPEINLVYTWVDGSDPEHIESRIKRAGNLKWAAPGNNRFRDLGGLKNSLRSVEAFAPWIKKIFIVTSGQIPPFVDLKNPQIKLISHHEMFDNPDDLPTFNSNAIEGNFHNLPDEVGPCFIYLNDEEKGQILFISSWTAPPSKDKLNNIWHKSVMNSNKVLDSLWGSERRNYASHGPYFFSLEVLRLVVFDANTYMYSAMPDLFNLTSTHPFRDEHDASIPFLYNQWAEHYFETTVAHSTINHYMKISDDAKKAKKDFDRILDRRPKTVCLNDALDEEKPNELSMKYMNEFFQKLFPKRSKFEKETSP